jgi:hypothetical protein
LSNYQDGQNVFSEIVEQFLAQHTQSSEGLQVSDRKLFRAFRAFWVAQTGQEAHPALLGQFRVTLTELGYRASGVKRPRWHNLALNPDETEKRQKPQPPPTLGMDDEDNSQMSQ